MKQNTAEKYFNERQILSNKKNCFVIKRTCVQATNKHNTRNKSLSTITGARTRWFMARKFAISTKFTIDGNFKFATNLSKLFRYKWYWYQQVHFWCWHQNNNKLKYGRKYHDCTSICILSRTNSIFYSHCGDCLYILLTFLFNSFCLLHIRWYFYSLHIYLFCLLLNIYKNMLNCVLDWIFF